MERVGEHPVPVGPLAVRWHAYEVQQPVAGVTGRARLLLENAGSAPWRSRGKEGVQVTYHWLDPLGNPIVWDGIRTAFSSVVAPGEQVELELPVEAPRPRKVSLGTTYMDLKCSLYFAARLSVASAVAIPRFASAALSASAGNRCPPVPPAATMTSSCFSPSPERGGSDRRRRSGVGSIVFMETSLP